MDSAVVATYVVGGATLGGSLLTLAYFLGRLSNRVEALENWRLGVDRRADEVFTELRKIEALIRGEAT